MANHKHPKFWSTPTGWAAMVLIAAVTYFLLVEHTEHLFEYLPYFILLLCPLMHLFMHGSHGNHQPEDHKDISDVDEQDIHASFQGRSEKGESYREGFIDGLKEARQEHNKKESDDAR